MHARFLFSLLLYSAFARTTFASDALEQKPFVIVVPSYNNAKNYQQNLDTLFAQQYENYRVVYVDDASTDSTGALVEDYALENGVQDRITIVHNEENQGALYNLYHAIHSSDDEEIILCVDGDDWLAHTEVLAHLNEVYSKKNILVTYGGFVTYPAGREYFGKRYTNAEISRNGFRKAPVHGWRPARSFYAGLFKKIRNEDLMYNGKFLPMSWDRGIMFPMLEMAGERFAAVQEVLYVYNRGNPISDHKKNPRLQRRLGSLVRNRKPYKRLSESVVHAVRKL